MKIKGTKANSSYVRKTFLSLPDTSFTIIMYTSNEANPQINYYQNNLQLKDDFFDSIVSNATMMNRMKENKIATAGATNQLPTIVANLSQLIFFAP